MFSEKKKYNPVAEKYTRIVSRLSDEDYRAIRTDEYWEARAICEYETERMKILIYAYECYTSEIEPDYMYITDLIITSRT